MTTIGIDASRANRKEKTGTEWYSYYLIQELKKITPNSVRVILYSKEPLRGDLAKLPKHWQSKVLHWLPRFLWTQLRVSWEMLKPWTRPDILFVPAHTIPVIHPRKSILVAHDIGFEKKEELYGNKDLGYESNFLRKFLKFLIRVTTWGEYGTTELDYHRWAMRFAIKHAHHIITVSNFSRQEIIDFYKVSAKRISTAHNGFAKDKYAPIKDKTREDYQKILKKYNIQQPYLLFIGRKEYKKNIPGLIEAYAILKRDFKIPHKLVLVGGPGYKYEEVEANIYQFKLADEVIEPGYIEQEDLNVIMGLADLFVLPSLYEGFGIPILEAMSAGTPVACANIPALKEVGESAAQYFDPENPGDMAQVIFNTLTDSSLQDQLQQNGFEQIKKFSWEKCGKETWEIINRFI